MGIWRQGKKLPAVKKKRSVLIKSDVRKIMMKLNETLLG